MKTAAKPARLYALIARRARKAVVFRRGPSKSVLVLAWDLETDTLEEGQWFKGRIYERRCDLSPDGEFLAYFAAKHRGPLGTWTAISRPPYLTALALWVKGDAWGGGALFDDAHNLSLNHRPGDESRLADGFALPRDLRVRPLGDRPGWGEDEPVCSMRLVRDGWIVVSPGTWSDYQSKGPYLWIADPPMVIEKSIGSSLMRLRVSVHGLAERNGPAYVQTARIVDAAGAPVTDLGRIDWADIDHNADVLFAHGGCLFRLAAPLAGTEPVAPKCVADLNGLTFAPRVAPQAATTWPRR